MRSPASLNQGQQHRMKDIYLLSGLGADKSVFEFLDLKGYRTHAVEWVAPNEDESVPGYAARLLSQIKVKKPILIGVSFGGILAIEIGKHIETEKIIIISSIKCKTDLPRPMRIAGFLKINKLIPADALQKPNGVLFWFFGVDSEHDKNLLGDIVKRTDPGFIDWGISSITTWQNEICPDNVIHIHGTEDRIFPIQEPNYTIEGGGHFMIVNRCKEISKILLKELK
jgi:pimeloyl-ACP methyl ester carboxylesterase